MAIIIAMFIVMVVARIIAINSNSNGHGNSIVAMLSLSSILFP